MLIIFKSAERELRIYNSSARRREGFTLAELLVVAALISLLTALLLPALGIAGENNRRAACIENLRKIGKGFQMYGNDYGYYPHYHSIDQGYTGGYHSWQDMIYRYMTTDWSRGIAEGWGKDKVFHCPSYEGEDGPMFGYALNTFARFERFQATPNPEKLVNVVEKSPERTSGNDRFHAMGLWQLGYPHEYKGYDGATNILYLTGRVETLFRQDARLQRGVSITPNMFRMRTDGEGGRQGNYF